MGMVFLGQAARGVLLAAVLADSVNLKGVAGGCVVVSVSDLLLQTVNLRREKFYRTAAPGADHVMVAAAVVLMLVAGYAIMKSDFAGQAAFRQQFQGPVNRGETDASIFFLHQPVQFVGGEVLAGFEEGSQDGVALRRMFQADTLEMLIQNLLRFTNHLGRDAGLVVDTLLQHGVSANLGDLLNNTDLYEMSQLFRGNSSVPLRARSFVRLTPNSE
jgi:hypothetical protein